MDKVMSVSIVKSKKVYVKLLVWVLFAVTMMVLFAYFYLRQPQFAQISSDVSYASQRMTAAYASGFFENEIPTPVLTRTTERSRITSLYRFLFKQDANSVPEMPLPSVKTDLFMLNPTENAVIWMGHSTYYLQVDGLRILVDPVFSENASPVPATNTVFRGSNIYTAQDIPELDYLLITHDHWDHLDYPTVMALKSKVKTIVTPLGVGTYFRQWGFEPSRIYEGDWYEAIKGKDNTEIHVLPARHFSGRLLTRNKTLWGSFAVITPNYRVYLGGDSGYGPHYKEIGRRFGRFDLAVLECGQYNEGWKYIHMAPEETAQAAADLNADAMLPSHNSKFKLSHHPWSEPLERVFQASQSQAYRLLTPVIGAVVEMDDSHQTFAPWWRLEQ